MPARAAGRPREVRVVARAAVIATGALYALRLCCCRGIRRGAQLRCRRRLAHARVAGACSPSARIANRDRPWCVPRILLLKAAKARITTRFRSSASARPRQPVERPARPSVLDAIPCPNAVATGMRRERCAPHQVGRRRPLNNVRRADATRFRTMGLNFRKWWRAPDDGRSGRAASSGAGGGACRRGSTASCADLVGRYEEHQIASKPRASASPRGSASHTRVRRDERGCRDRPSRGARSHGSSFVRSTTPNRHGARGRPVAVTLPGEP